jgi:hypothetical protein
MKKKKIDWGYWGYILAGLLIIGLIVGNMISYMSLNNWDIRCVLTECKPITVRSGDENKD